LLLKIVRIHQNRFALELREVTCSDSLNATSMVPLDDAELFYEKQARALVMALRKQKRITYRDLQLRLQAHGVDMELQPLINRVTRGNYSFAFALQLLAAMDVKTLLLPNALAEDGVRVDAMFSAAVHIASEAQG
jgi:hypothetical protein